MGYTAWQLLGNCLGLLVLPVYFVAPGYLVGYASDLLHFRSLSLSRKILWCLAISPPLAVLWAVHPGVPLTARIVEIAFVLMSVVALPLLARDCWRRSQQPFAIDRYTRWLYLALGVLVAYCLLAPLGVRVGDGLYESAASQTDWSVRTQLVNACLRGGANPQSPMFAFHGITVPLHTYFYWYVLVAQIALLTGISAQSALAASCVGAALTQIASMLLFLRYLPISRAPMRRQAAALAMAISVTGLDVLVFFLDLLRHRYRPDPQLALWDHTPGFLYTFLWSPHHVAGAAFCLTGLTLVAICRRQIGWRLIALACLAGVCFSMAAGTSTFSTAIFLLICLVVLVDAILRRDRQLIQAIAIGAVVAALLTLPFVRFMLASSAGASVNSASPVHLRPRYDSQASQIAYNSFYLLVHKEHPKHAKAVARVFRIFLDSFFLVVDLGLVLYVAYDRFRKDLPRRHKMTFSQRLLWMMFLTAAVPCFLVTSANIAHAANDAGFHAATLLRLVAALWAVPLILAFLEQRRPFSSFQRLGIALFVLAALSQVLQIIENRFQIAFVDRGLTPVLPVGERVPHVARRFEQIREAMDAVAQHTPADAIIQTYPHDRLSPALLMYTHRQLAASDDGCNLPFGGKEHECAEMVTQFNELFGGTPKYHGSPGTIPATSLDPALTTPANFEQVCRENHLSAIVADYTSPAWQHSGTWVWLLQPVFANATARVFLCPPS